MDPITHESYRRQQYRYQPLPYKLSGSHVTRPMVGKQVLHCEQSKGHNVRNPNTHIHTTLQVTQYVTEGTTNTMYDCTTIPTRQKRWQPHQPDDTTEPPTGEL